MAQGFGLDTARIAVIGLGYVGLPLAVEFARRYEVVGFDIDPVRIARLQDGHDETGEVEPAQLAHARASGLRLGGAVEAIAACNVYIVTVPTPISADRRPDLGPLFAAAHTVGGVLSRGNVVVFESTVYPGCTEEVCVPILEQASGLVFDRDFHVGYSPERINPGDRDHRLADIVKVTSGSSPQAAGFIDALYASIVSAGTHRAPSIKVAEAAKVIENTQRDLNIALVNDLAMLFNRLGIDTLDVLEAAGTKWNFLPFRPGLVGGHCIGVDPWYLTHKAQEVGHHPDMILAGRRTNDGMGGYVASRVVQLMVRKGIDPAQARVLVLGLAFKENCPDLRNTRVADLVAALRDSGARVDVHDPWVDAALARSTYGIDMVGEPESGAYDAVVVAVGHRQFHALGADGVRRLGRPLSVIYDIKYVLPRDAVDGRL